MGSGSPPKRNFSHRNDRDNDARKKKRLSSNSNLCEVQMIDDDSRRKVRNKQANELENHNRFLSTL